MVAAGVQPKNTMTLMGDLSPHTSDTRLKSGPPKPDTLKVPTTDRTLQCPGISRASPLYIVVTYSFISLVPQQAT